MDKLVYVETSVPSFYFDTRSGHDMQAMRDWTREWWTLPKFGQELVIGSPVLVELGEAPAAKRDKALGLIEELRILLYTDEITEIVEAYFRPQVDAVGRTGRCRPSGAGLLLQLRLAGHLELQTSGKREQVRAYSSCQWIAGITDAGARDATATIGASMKTIKHDDGLEWLREIRARLAKKFDYDPKKAAAYYQQKQKQLGARLYRPEVPTGADVHAVDTLHDRAHAEIAADQCVTLTSYRADRKRKAKRAK